MKCIAVNVAWPMYSISFGHTARYCGRLVRQESFYRVVWKGQFRSCCLSWWWFELKYVRLVSVILLNGLNWKVGLHIMAGKYSCKQYAHFLWLLCDLLDFIVSHNIHTTYCRIDDNLESVVLVWTSSVTISCKAHIWAVWINVMTREAIWTFLWGVEEEV